MSEKLKSKELSQNLINFCRKNGISKLKTADFEVEMHPSSFYPESGYKKKKALEGTDAPIQVENQFTEEEMLFWSSAGIPDTAEAN